MIVQVYEVSGPEEGLELARLGVDHIGALVGSGSFPRELSHLQARAIFNALPATAKGVALTLSADPEEIAGVIENVGPDIIHIGAAIELFSVEQMRELKSQFRSVITMRSIPVAGVESIAMAREHEGVADFLLLDSHVPGDRQIGGLGRTHDWGISRAIVETSNVPSLLAGGLSPENVADAIRATHAMGVDSKTRTDRDDGAGKDYVKVRQFVMAARAARF